MTATTGQAGGPANAGPGWHVLLRPRWLAWHTFVVVATAGMFFLGAWQLHRAESGNELSWAYTFEWPLFAAFTVCFWIKSLRDEIREHDGAASVASDSAATVSPAPAKTSRAAAGAVGPGETSNAAPVGRQAASWDATSWDATSWDATRREAGADGTGKPADLARATPADGEAYVARLMAEVRGPGRRRGRR